jgi:hypothetical protein
MNPTNTTVCAWTLCVLWGWFPPKSIRQTYSMPQPFSLFHSNTHAYGPNKEWIFNGWDSFSMLMKIRWSILVFCGQCFSKVRWEAGFAQLQAKIHETDLLHAPTIVTPPHRFPCLWTQQTMFDRWDAYSRMMHAGKSCLVQTSDKITLYPFDGGCDLLRGENYW